MDFYQEMQQTKEEQQKVYNNTENELSGQVENNQDGRFLKVNFLLDSEKNNIEKILNDKSQSDMQIKNKSYETDSLQNNDDLLEQKDVSTRPQQILKDQISKPLTKVSEIIKQQILYNVNVNKMINYSIEEEEKQQELNFQYGKDRDDTSSITKIKLLLDSESTQPTQKLQINQQQDQTIQYQKSYDEAKFLKNQGNQSFKQQKYGKAIEQYNLALGFCDGNYLITCPKELFVEFQKLRISILLHLSSCYINIGNLKQCIYHMNIVIQLDPLNPKVFYKRAIAHQLQFNYEDAYRDIEEAWNLVKNTTQDPDIFNKRKEILIQMESQYSQQPDYNGKQKKINQLESKSSLSDFYKTNSITSGIILGNRHLNCVNIIFKITASTILASWVTQYFLKEKIVSRNGLIQALTISFTTASCMIVAKKWQKYTLATVTLGILAISLNRKRGL